MTKISHDKDVNNHFAAYLVRGLHEINCVDRYPFRFVDINSEQVIPVPRNISDISDIALY